jgi:5'-nucleotidase
VHEGGQQNPPYAAGYEDSNGCEHLTGAIVPIVEGLDRAVDIVASAHTHQAYVCRIDGKVLTSAASFGRLITDLDLQLSRRTGDVAAVRARNVIVTRDVPKDRAETALVQRYAAQSAPIADRVVGTATEDLSRTPDAVGESEIGGVIADADRAATGAAVAFMNPGGIRGDVDAGDVTYGELFTVLPFGDSLVVKTLTGDQLYRLLAQQFDGDADTLLQVSDGFTYSYDRDGIVAGSVAIGGAPVDAAGSYAVAASSFLAAGGDGFTVFREAAPDRAAGVDLDALVSYVGAHSPLGAAAEPRITRRVASVF